MLTEYKSACRLIHYVQRMCHVTEWYSVHDLAASSGDGRDDRCGLNKKKDHYRCRKQ